MPLRYKHNQKVQKCPVLHACSLFFFRNLYSLNSKLTLKIGVILQWNVRKEFKKNPPWLEEICFGAVKLVFGNQVTRKYFENMKEYLNDSFVILFEV